MSASNDGSEDVDQFLARIASLSKKSGSEDAEQTRRMEEQMMQAKKERQARRAERARSISPSKTGPAAPLSSPSIRSPVRERLIDPPSGLAPHPPSQTHTLNRPESPTRLGSTRPLSALDLTQSRQLPQPPRPSPDSVESPNSRPSSSAGLSRSGTLSWQQRPTSRGIGSGFGSIRSRPLSGSRATSREPPESPRENTAEKLEDTPSRKDIATALGSRDPAWFRQTQDRGLGSAAYRKSEPSEDTTTTIPHQGLRLPGMADGQSGKDPVSLPTKQVPEQSKDGRAPRLDSPRRNTAAAYVVNQSLTHSLPSLSPTEVSVQQTSSDGDRSSREPDSTLDRNSNMFAGRSPSPTKGLGGFVQSAMMRRSDSVSKRWSVQASAGLKRGDSIASNKPNFNLPPTTAPSLGHARTLSREPRDGRDGTPPPQSTSRPTSSHAAQADSFGSVQKSQSEPHGLITPPSKRASADVQLSTMEDQGGDASLTRSPSKTLDPRRWSPTKASWLESALSKPESPRFSPTKEEVPPWKLDMQRSKSSKDLSEVAKKTIPHEPVSTPSLLRSPPPVVKTKPLDLPSSFTVANVQKEVNLPPQPESEPSVEKHAISSEGISGRNAMHNKQHEARPSTSETVTILPENVQSDDSAVSGNLKTLDGSRSSIDRKPSALKPKPETPPKTDFRASLKSRTPTASKNSEEPEFKAVFGKLKKAQTQNYVAPDMLKDNITRGKAALNVTGGPQPRKRVDDFKESILAQKEAMRAGGGSVHKKSDSRDASPAKPEKEVPEALQRRNTLHKSKASLDEKTAVDAKVNVRNPPPAVQIKPKPTWPSVKDVKADTIPARSDRSSSNSTLQTWKSEPEVGGDIGERMTRVEPTSTTVKSRQAIATPATLSDKRREVPAEKPAKMQDHPLKGTAVEPLSAAFRDTQTIRPTMDTSSSTDKRNAAAAAGLAARLNPALAGLIARGGSPKPASNRSAEQSLDITVHVSGSGTADNGRENAESLTHMTKARAKGPKRKAPKGPSGATSTVGKAVSTIPPAKGVVQKDGLKSSSFATTKASEDRTVFEASPAAAEKVKSPPPPVASKSPELRRVSGQASPSPQKADAATSKGSPKKTFAIATDSISLNSPTQSTTPGPTGFTNSSMPMPLTPSRSTLGVEKTVVTSGLGVKLGRPTNSVQTQEQTSPPEKIFQISQPSTKTSGPITTDSPIKQVLRSIFASVPSSEDKAEFDTEAILSAKRHPNGRIKTTSNQIWEISGEGKKMPLPQQQEHVLFEDSLYLVVHSYESSETSKKATECYLWTGDSVPSSAAEDAHLFCRKIARENSAKLEVVRQGKESSNFFAALGGIVVFRKSKASALYMLCGRRHLGHVTFDEVDFMPSALCSGFPYLISAKFGKLYLWKGQGSGADEIGAARLIGMDLGLTGEIEEVAEGKEPAAFWECFSSTSNAKAQFKPSDIWAMRSMDEKNGFPCRLYRLEAERPKSSGGGFWGLRAASPSKESNKATLTEIEPFVQADLEETSSVHVLDAWASIYVVPGSKSKSADFVTALHIAQEMAVLTPSMQDRAFLPSCEVVLDGVPSREVRAAFRKFVVDANQKEGRVFEVAEILRALD